MYIHCILLLSLLEDDHIGVCMCHISYPRRIGDVIYSRYIVYVFEVTTKTGKEPFFTRTLCVTSKMPRFYLKLHKAYSLSRNCIKSNKKDKHKNPCAQTYKRQLCVRIYKKKIARVCKVSHSILRNSCKGLEQNNLIFNGGSSFIPFFRKQFALVAAKVTTRMEIVEEFTKIYCSHENPFKESHL